MAKINQFKKLSVIGLIISIILFIIFLISLYFVINKFNQIDPTKARQYFSVIQNDLSQDKEPQTDGADYAVIALDGTVIESTVPNLSKNQKIDLKLLSCIDGTIEKNRVYFAAPFLKDGVQKGTLVLLIERNLVIIGAGGNIVWLAVLSLLFISAVFLFVKTALIIKEEIAFPLKTLCKIANKMAGGDYGEKLLYDYNDEMGGLCHDLEVLRDALVSSRNRERELKKNEKFLLACISHDLKTPLSVITGTAESLNDNIITPEQAATVILNKAIMLNKLIDDILEQTKTELGEFSINKTECYAKNFFEKEITGLERQAKKKGLHFIISACPDCIINIDKQRILQVMENLIGNAIKYTKEGGSVTVDFEIKEKNLTVSVVDTGTGIPAQDLPFIFDKFFRGEKARNSETSGSGLGLPIAKYIVEKHGGKIECDTLLGKGTEIRFSLPLE